MKKFKKILLNILLATITFTIPIKSMEKDEHDEEKIISLPNACLGRLPNELKLLIQLQAISIFVHENPIAESTQNFGIFMSTSALQFLNRNWRSVVRNSSSNINFYFMDLIIKKIKQLNPDDRDWLIVDALDSSNTFLSKILYLFQDLEDRNEELSLSNAVRIDMQQDLQLVHPKFYPRLFAIKFNHPDKLKFFLSNELPPINQELSSIIKQILENDDAILFENSLARPDIANSKAFASYLALGIIVLQPKKVLKEWVRGCSTKEQGLILISTACMLKSKKMLKKLLIFFSINDRMNENGQTMLMINLFWNPGGNYIAQFMIKKGADVNIQDNDGNTALHLACFYGDKAFAELLLNNNANSNSQNRLGVTPLMLAVPFKDVGLIELLLQKDLKTDINIHDNRGFTALQWTCFLNDKQTVKTLLRKDANPNLKDDIGNTALHLAVILNDIKLAQILLNHGAKADIMNDENITPLDIARYNENQSLKLLLQRSNDQRSKNN